jgi:hypothetical protein
MWKRALPALLALGVFAGCGGGGSSGSASGGGCPSSGTVHITSTGFSTRSICVEASGHFIYANGDTVAHTVTSTTSAGCAGVLTATIDPAATDTISLPSVNGSCDFVDEAHPGDPAFIGTLTTTGAATGGGY